MMDFRFMTHGALQIVLYCDMCVLNGYLIQLYHSERDAISVRNFRLN